MDPIRNTCQIFLQLIYFSFNFLALLSTVIVFFFLFTECTMYVLYAKLFKSMDKGREKGIYGLNLHLSRNVYVEMSEWETKQRS